jgi:glucosamine--fructose-6-phosphate aminotransferase (isomerizing)
MCGIVGYVGVQDRAQDLILDGLRRLEYRGYDSAGMAVLDDGKLRVVRTQGKLINLEAALRDVPLKGSVGMGHTRWATHGRPSERNAHPHRAGGIAIIHNGIVENHRALREELLGRGCRFESDTDTEIIAHLIELERKAGVPLLDAVQKAVRRIQGSYAIGVLDEREPDRLIATRNGGSPAIVSWNDKEGFFASDIPAILPYTRRMVPLEDGDVAVVRAGSLEIFDAKGAPVERAERAILWDPVQAEKGLYDRFMQKEIYEQPRAVSDTIGTRVHEEAGDIDLDGIRFDPAWVKKLHSVHLVGMGTARHACMIGASIIERLARIPVEVDLSSEYRYRDPVLGPDRLVVAVSQSGETTDTLQALRQAKEGGARLMAITNTQDSTIAREAGDALYTHAGPEIGVASTKCFTTQIVALHLLALKLGLLRGTLTPERVRAQIEELRRLPRMIEKTLALWSPIEAMARRYFKYTNFLYLGRGIGVPVAYEGALKLKEISYIHAEGYAAGEMKHGPIALIDENMPVVIIANNPESYAKILSNAEQVKARGGLVIAVVAEGDRELGPHADDVIEVPALAEPLCAIMATVPLQIFAYHVATLKGTDVDQPRNLAKSVTVE